MMKTITKLSAALAVIFTLGACNGPHDGPNLDGGPVGGPPPGGEMQAPAPAAPAEQPLN